MKRWFGLLTMLFVLGAAGCTSSTSPRFPDSDDDGETPTDDQDPDHGLSLSDPVVFWA